MNQLKKNITANFIGNIWQSVIGIVFIPFYIKYMGAESYGLIGIFGTFLAISTLLDLGLSATMTREMARLSSMPGKDQEMRNLVRSLEIIYILVAIFIGLTITLLSPFIAHSWIKCDNLSHQTVEQAIRFMGLALALQWPSALYTGGLTGLQRQVLLNTINIGISTLRGGGAVLILWLISPTIHAFFSWQIVVSSINTGVLFFYLWRNLPSSSKKTLFQKHLLKGIWRFAAGMSGITLLSVILTQIDKIILSKILSLEMFGYYTLAATVANTLTRVAAPISTSIYPKIIQLVATSNQVELKQFYHQCCQLVSVLVFPITIVIAVYSNEILLLWTHNTITAEKTHFLLSILICGTSLNLLGYIPYALVLANGWTKVPIYINLVSIVVLVPLIIYLTKHFGALGGASVWLILNSGYVFISTPIIHRLLLPSENWRWYSNDICLPLVISLAVVLFSRLVFVNQMSYKSTIVSLFLISFSTLTITALFTPVTRIWFFNKLSSLQSMNETKIL